LCSISAAKVGPSGESSDRLAALASEKAGRVTPGVGIHIDDLLDEGPDQQAQAIGAEQPGVEPAREPGEVALVAEIDRLRVPVIQYSSPLDRPTSRSGSDAGPSGRVILRLQG
jgi:hypothetical protein